jgi:hypothetical protein
VCNHLSNYSSFTNLAFVICNKLTIVKAIIMVVQDRLDRSVGGSHIVSVKFFVVAAWFDSTAEQAYFY